MKKTLLPALLFFSMQAFAQHDMHKMQHDSMPAKDSMHMNMHEHGHMNMPGMNHAYSLSLPMNRNSSGTAWNPDNTPMYMLMKHGKKDMWMFHGSVWLRYNNQELTDKTSRSGAKFDAPNWFMAMYNRQVGSNGLLNVTGMFSLDALTVGNAGYPLLFQSGESYNGRTLVDRQHPHDLFAALSVGYTQRLSKSVDVFGYFGYPGEPAISAPTFMHRISAMNDPDAPLSHHWQDATHITFGVATLGVRVNKLKLELSNFTGREPDEKRYGFDKMKFDSYSYRLSYNPGRAWAIQFSQAYLESPELLHPSENIWRYTASVLYATPVRNDKFFTGAFVWGMNDAGKTHKEHSLLLEGTQQLKTQAVYGRYEFVQKSAEELALDDAFDHDYLFNIHKLTLGTNRKLFAVGKIDLLAGLQVSANLPPASLHYLYGQTPLAGQVYLQLRPSRSKM
ncbi:hypothetical protein I5907_17440 [Panacibacter sp. DH6]|uniref:Uncharacterized protein n=1 Tax=Panacibacter microcysteis TaxID=2793269 RepID=A0A931GZ57_9BACT|nr:hypothetical protein [Panacibacter microcysteis]MBG9378027.1 hypothetical protein [Panacibacter microcysteis]